MRIMEKVRPIKRVHELTVKRYQGWLGWLEKNTTFQHLIKNKTVHSFTVLPIESTEQLVEETKRLAKKKGFLLGEGYGDLKSSTFRIANFPALKAAEIADLKRFMASFSH
jgi:phosphoserine aminotransferase